MEFDGIKHYQNFDKALSDISRTEYLEGLGYKIVRIPFWIQLSKDYVKYAFDVEVESLCELKYSFFDSGTEDFGLSVSPVSFNVFGAIRFKKELEALPLKCRSDVIMDLQEVKNHSHVDPMPFSIFGMNMLS